MTDDQDSVFVDWPEFWERVRHDQEWLIDPILARGRGHVLFAYHKTGKSLLALWLAVTLARHHPVVYLDYEMGDDDLHERLVDMGYGPHIDLSRLHYALLPSIPPLDTSQGARTLDGLLDTVETFHPGEHIIVVIDTMGRAVEGEENSSDTYRSFYRYTGFALKRRGATWLRLDHAGKDDARSQRGSSGKGDDVDIVWKLRRVDDGFLLLRDAARMAWIPEKVALRISQEPFGLQVVPSVLPAGTADLVALLDTLGVDADLSVAKTQEALRQHNFPKRKEVVVAAVRERRDRAEPPGNLVPGQAREEDAERPEPPL